MTSGCHVWVRDRLQREAAIAGDVLEVGSRDVNGSIRDLFLDRRRFGKYVGVDIVEGPGVDIMASGHRLPFDDRQFGVVVILEMLEHDAAFWLTLAECWRILRPGGWLIATTRAFGFPRHDHPNDYWRFTVDGLRTALQFSGFQYADCVEDHADLGVFAVARRLPSEEPALACLAPHHAALLPESQVTMLRDRMAALVPLGITAMADAFARVEDDRRLLCRLLGDVMAETPPLSSELAGRIKAALWETQGG